MLYSSKQGKNSSIDLDNEASLEFKQAIKKDNMEFQLVTLHMHRANLAEKAIQTFKNHFKAILSGVDDSFPLHLWDRLLPQAEMTLNMLRPSNISPHVSAHMYAFGVHDFNVNPLAPLGCAVQIYERPEVRKTWDLNSIDGWYIGPAMENYRNFVIHCKQTNAERKSDTVWFKHKYLTNPNPTVTAADTIVHAAKELTAALNKYRPADLKQSNKDGLAKLAKIFNEAAIKYSNKEAEKRVPLPGVGQSKTHANREAAPPGVHKTVPTPGVDKSNASRPGVTTRSQNRSVTTEAILSAIKISAIPLKTQRLASRKFPLAMLCEIAGAVLDSKTGDGIQAPHGKTRVL
jgi:hypothetical protein